jgi:hypothetical protein
MVSAKNTGGYPFQRPALRQKLRPAMPPDLLDVGAALP